MSIKVTTKALEQLEVNGKTVTLQCGEIVNEYDLTPKELAATKYHIAKTKSHYIKSTVV